MSIAGWNGFGFEALSEAPEDRIVASGSSTSIVDWQIVIYAAKHEFISRITDTPPDQMFKGTLEKAYRLDRSIIGSNRIGKSITVGVGEVTLSNQEADYDSLSEDSTPLGQPIQIRRGHVDQPYDDWQVLFNGFMVDQRELTRELITFGIRDAGHKLDVPLSPNTYLGTGDQEGGADLKEKRKPRAFGYVSNVTPALVNSTFLIYQVNDGSIGAVENVYVRGVALAYAGDFATYTTLGDAALSVGQYATCIALGLFRIAVASGSEIGQVTADVIGDTVGGFSDTAAEIVRKMLVTSGTTLVDPDDLVETTFTELNTLQPAEIGYYCPPGDDQSVATAVGRVMSSIGGWCGARRTGKFEVRRFEEPEPSPSDNFTEDDLVDVQMLTMPADLKPPPWRILVGYSRNWTVQSSDLAGTVTTARRQFLEAELRYAPAESEVIRADFPPGHEITETDSYFRDEADALAEAERLLDLWGADRALYSVKLAVPYAMELGNVVRVQSSRFDLALGKYMRIVRITEDDSEGTEIVGLA